jgi:hypothetical protein
MKKAIWNDPVTGVASIMVPAYNDELRDHGLTDGELFARVVAKGVPPGAAYEVIDDALPAVRAFLDDRTFRGAWECGAEKGLTCHMPKARAIHVKRIRKVRNAELAKLDVPFMKAVEAGDTGEQQRIAELKQSLRDIPQTLTLSGARTQNALKKLWPSLLPPTLQGKEEE